MPFVNGFKKVTINFFENDQLKLRSSLTCRGNGVVAKDYQEAKEKVWKLIAPHVQGENNFTVDWTRDQHPEGFMVKYQ